MTEQTEIKETPDTESAVNETDRKTIKLDDDLDNAIHFLAEGEQLTRPQRDVWEARANEIIEKIRPYIQHDGGDVQLLGIAVGEVCDFFVRLTDDFVIQSQARAA